MSAPIAPVLQRIAAIESRFGQPRVPTPVGGPSFVEVMKSVDGPDTDPTPGDATTPAAAAVAGSAAVDRNGVGALGTEMLLAGRDRRQVAVPLAPTDPWFQRTAGSAVPTPAGGPLPGFSPAGGTSAPHSHVGHPAATGSFTGGTASTPIHPPHTAANTGVPVFTGSTESLPPGGSVTPGTPFADRFQEAGARHGVPAQLLAAVGWVESRYSVDAVSPHGAMGVMQIMPGTARELGVDPYDPVQAIDGAARLLADHRDRFGSWDLALAAYHSGGGAVSRAGNRPPPRAATYVQLVHERLETM